jgi:hypothetical protein
MRQSVFVSCDCRTKECDIAACKSNWKQKPEQSLSVCRNNSDFLYHIICQWRHCLHGFVQGSRSDANVLSQSSACSGQSDLCDEQTVSCLCEHCAAEHPSALLGIKYHQTVFTWCAENTRRWAHTLAPLGLVMHNYVSSVPTTWQSLSCSGKVSRYGTRRIITMCPRFHWLSIFEPDLSNPPLNLLKPSGNFTYYQA